MRDLEKNHLEMLSVIFNMALFNCKCCLRPEIFGAVLVSNRAFSLWPLSTLVFKSYITLIAKHSSGSAIGPETGAGLTCLLQDNLRKQMGGFPYCWENTIILPKEGMF